MVLIVKSNARGVAQAFRKIARDIKNTKSPLRELGLRGQALAKRLAPVKSGRLKQGIFFRLLTNKLELVSHVPGQFKYNQWVNMDIPTIRGVHPYFSTAQGRIAYGQPGVTSPNGKAINWTGTPGYFNLTFQKMAKDSGRVFEKHISRSLRAKG